jgi:acetyltransferase-like isoleucine patch superfamily enzyme
MGKTLDHISESAFIQLLITIVTYAFYASIIGLSLSPSIMFLAWAWKVLVSSDPRFLSWIAFSLCAGAAVYIYFITGILVMGVSIRCISSGIKPGIYPDASPTMFRWLIYSGIYTLARATILPMVPMTFFSNLFFKLLGCKMGRRVFLNTWTLNDPYLIRLGDDVTIGGGAELSCHIYEKGRLILDTIDIGDGSLVGANCYISPGVSIGSKCVIGLGSVLRRGKRVADGAHYTSLAGLPVREMAHIEKGSKRLRSGVER